MATGDRNDPLTAFNFIVDIQGMKAGFSDVDGLSGETTVVEYRNGNEPATPRKFAGQNKYPNLVLKRGFTPTAKELWQWRLTVINGKTQRLSGTITLLDEGRQPALMWHFLNGWISKWTGPTLSAKDNNVALEAVEIAHEGLVLE